MTVSVVVLLPFRSGSGISRDKFWPENEKEEAANNTNMIAEKRGEGEERRRDGALWEGNLVSFLFSGVRLLPTTFYRTRRKFLTVSADAAGQGGEERDGKLNSSLLLLLLLQPLGFRKRNEWFFFQQRQKTNFHSQHLLTLLPFPS